MSSAPLPRRDFLQLAGVGLLAATFGDKLFAAAPPSDAPGPFVLSHEGSGRATGYGEASKIITAAGKTHVAWLDADAEKFRVRVRTLDLATGAWSPTVDIGPAHDNHGGPALTIDSKGYLHIVYFPHHRPFHYRRSLRPHDTSAWSPEIEFGESLSYPVVLVGPDDTIYMTCRRYYEAVDHLNEMEFWKKPADGEWARQRVVLRSRHLAYVQFQDSLAWGADHRTIHLSCRIYETAPVKGAKPIETLGYLRSPDLGITWQKLDGSPVTLPATAETVEILARGGADTGRTLSAGSLAVDPKGVPHLLHSVRENGIGRTYLATPAPGGGWTRRDLQKFLPAAWRDHDFVMIGAITFSPSGRATIIGTLAKLGPGEVDWAHPSNEIVRLWSDDGTRTFRSEVLSPIDPKTPHWLPNLERPTGHHAIPEEPGIIYLAGGAGSGLKDLALNNQVWWHRYN
ncbi:MAG: BNR-4 repeat-containing protein [Undibacterium sp.]|nr:BNR-4 repeat-containing protein [Opitutaceae bacterium]